MRWSTLSVLLVGVVGCGIHPTKHPQVATAPQRTAATAQGSSAPTPPDTPLQAKIKLATALFQQGKDQEAEKLLLEIVEQDAKQPVAYNFLGIIYGRTHQFEKSIAAFQRVVELAPNFAGAYFGMGVAYKELNNPERALESFRKAVAILPNYPVAWSNIAIITDTLGQVEDAVPAYQRVLATADKSSAEYKQAQDRLTDIGDDPEIAKKVRALMAQATELSHAGKGAEAVPLYQEAASLRPKSVTIRLILAQEAANAGNFAASETALQQIVAIDPGDLVERRRLAQFQALTGKTDDAIKSYGELLSVAVNRDETLPEVEQARSDMFRLMDEKEVQDHLVKADVSTLRNWQEAIQELRAAQAIAPYSPLILYNLFRVYQQAGYRDPAVATGRELLLIQPKSRDAHLLLGKVYEDQHFYFRSMGEYLTVISLATSQQERQDLFSVEALVGVEHASVAFKKAVPQAITNYAKALRSSAAGDTKSAISFLKLSILVTPEAPLMHYQLGKIYAESGETEDAIRELKESVKGAPGSYPAILLLSELYVKKRWWNNAVEAFDTLLRLPDATIEQLGTTRARLQQDAQGVREELAKAHEQARELFKQGQAAFQKGDVPEAVSHFLPAVEAEPDNPNILYSLGVAYAARGDSKAAVKAFENVLAFDPSHVGAKFRLGVVLEASGAYGLATTQYREFLAMPGAKDHPEYAEAEERLKKIAARFDRLHRSERHAELGLPVLTATTEPSKEELTVALWHWKQAVKLNPKALNFYYNLGLAQERVTVHKVKTENIVVTTRQENQDLFHDAIETYHTVIKLEPSYLIAYLRLGQLYESTGSKDQAVAIYKDALSQKSISSSDQGTKAEMQARVAALTRHLFVSSVLQSGYDNNFSLTSPSQEDFFETVSVDVTYFLMNTPKLQFSAEWQNQASVYLRSQTIADTNTFSGSLQRVISPSFVGNLKAQVSQSFFKDIGLTSAGSVETVGLTYYGKFPAVNNIQYSFTGVSYTDNSSLNMLQHQASYTGSDRVLEKYDLSFGYAFTWHTTASSPDNDYMMNQGNLRVQWPVRPELTASLSVSRTLQDFLHIDTFDGTTKRKNVLTSYGGSLAQRLTALTSLAMDIQVQQSESNLGATTGNSPVDILLGRSSSLGTYTKRVITLTLAHSF